MHVDVQIQGAQIITWCGWYQVGAKHVIKKWLQRLKDKEAKKALRAGVSRFVQSIRGKEEWGMKGCSMHVVGDSEVLWE